jgi:CRP-like cAMP-binding protein
MRRRHIAPGETLFAEGDTSDEAYLIRSGRVEVLKATPHGAARLAVLGPGDVLGEMGLLQERPRSAGARALDALVLDAVSRDEFTALLTRDPAQAMDILRVLFERLRNMNERLGEQSMFPTAAGTSAPQVRLFPLTAETRAALSDDGLAVSRFPFRVGRKTAGAATALSFNDLEFPDRVPYVLSLNHFAVDCVGDGFVVRDRGSQYGTLVNGERIGGSAARDVARLGAGENEIVAGIAGLGLAPRPSPFRFLVAVP